MTPPPHSKASEFSSIEERWHSISHGIGAALGLIGMAVLVVLTSLAAHTDAWAIAGASLYGTTLVLLYSVSTLYHAAQHPRWKRLFKLLDHCAIYTLIAGTYTPFLLVNLRGPMGWALFGIVWGLALGGIALKLAWPRRFGLLRIVVYLTMGWLILIASGEMSQYLSTTTITLLVAGGVTYTLGVIFYALPAIPFHHVIWHCFVLGGSICHYFAIYTALLL